MRRRTPGDALRLDPDVVAWHQSQSFVTEPETFADRLQASPLFLGEFRRGRGRADWIRLDDEADVLPFPLGRVTVHDEGVLLEAFAEERMTALRARVQDLNAGTFTADETRAFPLRFALQNPGALAQPLEEKRGEALDRRDVARTWLRMAWPFIPRADLGDRPPVSVLGTGRGDEAVAALLPVLAAELAAVPDFPRLAVEELRAILFAPAEPRPSPARAPLGGAPRS